MDFGEKLLKLRKEKALSQDALAERLNTTRQAVSKWENGQGFPETEKLLLLANLFEVSVDYLLKDSAEEKAPSDRGFYVSREMALGYFANQARVCRFMGAALALCLLGGVPYCMLAGRGPWQVLGTAVCIVLGVCVLVVGALKEDEQYQVLEREPLLLDGAFLKELTEQYHRRKGKYQALVAAGAFLAAAGLAAIFLTREGWLGWSEYHALAFLLLALGVFGLVQGAGKLESYELLVKNQQHCGRFWFKLRRKIKHRLDAS